MKKKEKLQPIHTRPPRVQPNDEQRRQIRREAHRVNQRRCRERKRALINNKKNVPVGCDLNEQGRAPYIPEHQTAAVASFFARLQSISTVPGFCSTCKESYHGMRLRGVQCERCFNEVRFPSFLSTVEVTGFFSQRNGHRYDGHNLADPGLIPDALIDVVHDITQMEEMLCSLASPCFLMWVSKGGQYKTRGNVISFSQDVSELYSVLPRLPEELDILLVRKPDARNPSSYKDFRVRKQKVLDFLKFLKAHNPFYAHVQVRPAIEVDLPLDGDISHRLPNVVAPDGGSVVPQDGGLTAEECEEERFEPEDLTQEQTCFVPSSLPGVTELHCIQSKLLSSRLSCPPREPIPWPTQGEALSEFNTDGLFSKAFPALFPLGLADYSLPRDKKLALYEWAKHLMRFHDSRFARHPRFRFYALNLVFRHRAMGRGKYLFSRDIGSHDMTVGQLRHALTQNDGHILASKIVRCLQTVRGTRPYWYMEGAKLRDMIEQIGAPTLFYTLSMADLSWPDLHRLMPENPFADGLTYKESYLIRCRNLANNPHIVSSYLSVKHHHLHDTVFQHLDRCSETPLVDFWYRVEWQARGSGQFFMLSCTRSCSSYFFFRPVQTLRTYSRLSLVRKCPSRGRTELG